MAPSPQGLGVHVQDPGDTMNTFKGDEVVITGISGLFPSSDNAKEFAENLFNKVDMVTEDDLDFHHPEAPKHLGKINGVTKFDAQFFRIIYNQATTMDPMSKKLLEQAYMAMYDSGVNPLAYRGRKVGVFIGSSHTDTSNTIMYYTFKNKGNALSGCAKSMFANRFSFWIDAKGPSYTVDCSCISSMLCLEHAYSSMAKGECDAAIIGGCNLCMEPRLGLNLRKSGFTCLDGKTKCFDKNGDGFVRAEAISCMFLQKAKEAKRIYAEVCYAKAEFTLRNNSDFLSPRRSEELEEFFNTFYSEINVSPKEVEYVEANATANAEEDANELEAISKVFAKDGVVKVGSVKSNMGNSEPASGICAVTKMCLAYHQGRLPGNLHYSEPLDIPALKEGRIKVLQENTDFKRGYTAINNFSFNGNTCHVLLKGHFKPKDISKYKCEIPRLVLISGRQDSCVDKIIDILKSEPVDPEVIGMLHNIYKIDTPGHTSRGYTILDTNENNETVCLGQSTKHYTGVKRPLWLVFSGMGSQWPGMAADLMKIPTFANAIIKCHKALEPFGVDLIKVLTEPDKTIFDNILNCFIGISAVQIGLTDVLKEIGIVPDYVIGHSQGEMGCAYFDNCFTTEDMILAAYSRGIVSLQTEFITGSMAAIGLGYKDVLPLCPPEIDVACRNSNESSTLSGPADALKQFVAELSAKGIFAREVPCANIAFHSRYIAHAGPAFLDRLRKIIEHPPLRSEKWISTSVPEEKWDEPLAKYSSAEYHTNNLLSPVLFEEAARLIPENAVVVEVAPHGLLQAILKRSHPECVLIPLTRRGVNEQVKFLFEAFGKIYQEGFDFNLEGLYPKIDFPVATETQLLSHFVDWEHSEDWPKFIRNLKNTAYSASRECIISVHDDQYKYLAGHVRNGENVFPESAILKLVWETLSMYSGKNYKDLSVFFKNVQFYGEVIIKAEEPIKLNVMINKGNDYFEVTHDDIVLANGYIACISKPVFINIKEEPENEDENITNLTEDDVYKCLHVKGFSYKNEFQTIKETNFKRTEAQIEWSGNWVTLLDSLIQLNTLSRDYDGVLVPKIIQSIIISIDEHNKEQKTYSNEKKIKVKLYKVNEVTRCVGARCGGVEIRDIIFENRPNQEKQPDVVEHLNFVPHLIVGEVSIETALQLNLQMVADNIDDETIRITEITNTSKLNLSGILKAVTDRIANLNVEICTVDVENTKKNFEKTNLIIVQDNIFENGTDIDNVINKLNNDTFILVFYNNASRYKNGHFKILSSMMTQGKDMKLLRKIDCSPRDTQYISVDCEDNFAWIPVVKSELQKTKRVVLVSERQPHCGLFGLVKKLKKEYKNKISLVIIDDYHAASFNPEKSLFKEQLAKNLAFNIYVKGQWGGYYNLPINNAVTVQNSNFKLINTSFGNIDNLRWTECPTIPASNNLVQVYYAGPSLRDSEKAVGINENDHNGFGMDFSGIDSKGDKVMGLISGGSIASSIQADSDFLWPVPSHWTLEEAATVPLPYVHACYCLALKCNLMRGQSVFVNGGAGALGQAVISLCLALNCTVYTSVSEDQKKKFLKRLFPQLDENNIGCSRNGDFHSMVVVNTNGKKCDLVINCASGTSREAAMKCVTGGGIIIDVSTYDSIQNKSLGMSFVTAEKSYKASNLSSIFLPQNSEEKKLLQMMIAQGIKSGYVKPLSRVVYPATEVSRAFRLLSANRHRGRVLIRIKDAEISAKSLNVIPRSCYSSKGTNIVFCDESEIGVELANRLVSRGARKIILHLKSKTVSGYLHTKLASWSKLGTSVIISRENMNSEKNCVQIIKDAEKLGRVQGIFIVQELTNDKNWSRDDFIQKYDRTTSLVVNLDVTSRHICPDLTTFVVISRTSSSILDEYTTSVSDKICKSRLAVGLHALSFRIKLLDEHNCSHIEEGKIQPQNITTVLNALESSLRQKQSSSVTTFNLKSSPKKGFLEKVAKTLGLKNIDDVDQSITVGDLLVNEINIEELKTLLKNTFKIEYTIEILRNASIESFKTLSQSIGQTVKNRFDSGLGAFYTFVNQDEFMATDLMIPMHTFVHNPEKSLELDEASVQLMLIPGFDGQHENFKPMCERLKIRAMTFQLGPDAVSESIEEAAVKILKLIKKTFVFKTKFYLMGYSFGVNVALETAALLEKEGHVGVVYCLDSSPDALKVQLDAYIGNQTEAQLQNLIIDHMSKLMIGENEIFKEDLERIDNWSEKVDLIVNRLRSSVTISSEYERNVLDSAYHRISLARTYQPILKLNSELVLIKGIPHPKSGSLEADYGLSKYTSKPVKVFEIASDHAMAPRDCRLPNIINNLLEPELLHEFMNKNFCDTYLLD